ncbi:hypothetical protein POM88_010412 [Heracleum sosnowskyi]|uniref:Uncharacterized protein n=1 Tax=Heracleum sosnowskyi TaxID=360622 RepID=A0AAD8ITF1_9APIA|nr:hypothetical protein POM88_010412 [Heracleum sosnowskyi]
MAQMLSLKADHHLSEACYDQTSQFIKGILPQDNTFLDSSSGTKRYMEDLGLPSEQIDCCVNGCMIYWGEDINMESCKFCSHAKYKERHNRSKKEKKKVHVKRMIYFPLAPRLQSGGGQSFGGNISIFSHPGRSHGNVSTRYLDDREYMAAHNYILFNCPEVAPYIEIFINRLREHNPHITSVEVDQSLESDFAMWFKHYKNNRRSGVDGPSRHTSGSASHRLVAARLKRRFKRDPTADEVFFEAHTRHLKKRKYLIGEAGEISMDDEDEEDEVIWIDKKSQKKYHLSILVLDLFCGNFDCL